MWCSSSSLQTLARPENWTLPGWGGFQIRQHQRIHGSVLFLGLVIHLQLFLAAGFLVGGVENLLFQLGMNGHFHFQLAEQLGTRLHGALGGFGQARQQVLYALMILDQQVDGVHVAVLFGFTGLMTGLWRPGLLRLRHGPQP